VVGKVSPWLDPDADNPALRRDSEAALAQELAWAAHLSLQACLLPPPPQPLSSANYARVLNQVGVREEAAAGRRAGRVQAEGWVGTLEGVGGQKGGNRVRSTVQGKGICGTGSGCCGGD
jgi:hypothetical protein